MLQAQKKMSLSAIHKFKYKVIGALLFSIVSMYNCYAGGFYVADLEREYYEEYAPAPRPRAREVYEYRERPAPRSEKVYVYRDEPPRPKPQKVYVYRDEPPRPKPQKVYVYRDEPPRPKPEKVYVYRDEPIRPRPRTVYVTPPQPINTGPLQRQAYGGPSFFSQNNFLMFKVGGFKIDGFGGNSDISNSMQSYVLGAGVGHMFSDYINGSIELDIFSKAKGEQFNKSQNVLRKWDLSSNMLTANAAISLFPGRPVDFYVKVGLGMSNNKSDTYTWTSGNVRYYQSGESNYSMAWKTGFGIKVNTLYDMDTSLEYMFVDRGSFKSQNLRRTSNTDKLELPKEAKFQDHTLSLVLSKKIS